MAESSGALTPEQVKALLKKPTRKKKTVDPNVRDLQTWFKLAPSVIDEHAENRRCANPNCTDPRPPTITSTGLEIKAQYCIEIKGQNCCRFCFLNGWLLDSSDQEALTV